MKRKPWMKFNAQDWLTDIELRSCSSAARGTLIDLMCIAHRASEYGVIMQNDTPEARKMIAKSLSLACRTFDNHLSSLLHMQRILHDVDNKLIIKRMVEDFAYSVQQSELGSTGGNPTLKAPLKLEKSKSKSKRENKNKNSKRGGETPPTIIDLNEYAQKRNWANFNSRKFLDFYVSKGWMVGRSKMKDWNAAASRAYNDGWAKSDVQNDHVVRGKQAEKDRDNILEQLELRSEVSDLAERKDALRDLCLTARGQLQGSMLAQVEALIVAAEKQKGESD